MEGIEVLATIPEGTNLVANLPFAIIVGGIVWLGVGIWYATETDSIISGLVIGFLVGAIAFMITAGISMKPTEFIDTYKVTISDDIKLNEFYERYEILEQEGKIFTIKEKTEDGNNGLPTS